MPDLKTLAREAEGDSVTAARLRGDGQYFPDCRPFLRDGQQPEHLVLLSTSGNAVSVRLDNDHNKTHSQTLSASTGGLVVLARASLLVVVDDADYLEVPYCRMTGCGEIDGSLEVPAGGFRYRFNVARSADETEVEAGVHYLRRRLVEAATAR